VGSEVISSWGHRNSSSRASAYYTGQGQFQLGGEADIILDDLETAGFVVVMREEVEQLRGSRDEWEAAARSYLQQIYDEREACARVVEAKGSDHDPQLAEWLAAAIRVRGAKQ